MDDSPVAELSHAVRQARRRAGMTQAALAAACGLSRQTVAAVEAGTFSDLGVRKLARMLSALGLVLQVADGAAAGRPRSRIEALFARRAAGRRRRAMALAGRALARLRASGVKAIVVGSLAAGRFRADSDVDLLVEDRGALSESRILDIVEAEMEGFPFDVTFAERADRTLAAAMRNEARRGASAVRPA
jgi:DNA-binding XRE family transcriptional regulator/predicted nucleotidyltransferase